MLLLYSIMQMLGRIFIDLETKSTQRFQFIKTREHSLWTAYLENDSISLLIYSKIIALIVGLSIFEQLVALNEESCVLHN